MPPAPKALSSLLAVKRLGGSMVPGEAKKEEYFLSPDEPIS